jgi:hypothetical protein
MTLSFFMINKPFDPDPRNSTSPGKYSPGPFALFGFLAIVLGYVAVRQDQPIGFVLVVIGALLECPALLNHMNYETRITAQNNPRGSPDNSSLQGDPFADRERIEYVLALAGDHIRAGRYREARIALETIRNDPKAAEWLTRLADEKYQ